MANDLAARAGFSRFPDPAPVVALSGFLMGFDGSLFTGATVFVKQQFALTTFEWGWTNASQTLSATIAIFLAGPLADRFGRRAVLRAAALLFACAALVSSTAQGLPMLICGRLLSGLGIGAVLVAGPMYIAELAPAATRGRMVTWQQLCIVLGIALAFVSNLLVVRSEGAAHAGTWRWMLALGAAPALAYLVALAAVPESPRWLALRGRFDAAQRILERAHGAAPATLELAEIRASLARQQGQPRATLRDLRAPQLRAVLGVAILVGIFQQITGISSVLTYATVIFERAGAGADASFVQTVYVGVVNFVFTLLALLLIDRLGRRPLFLAGLAGMAVSLALAAVGFGASETPRAVLVLGGLLGFVACFAASLGPGLWVLLPEVFPNRVRALAISCVGFVNSTVCFLVQLVFPWQMERLGGAVTFGCYAAAALVGLLLLMKTLPETRGRSLEQLEGSLVRRP